MQTSMVCADQRWHIQATSVTMSDYMEILNPQSMLGKLYYQGEVVEIYEIEQCDKCSKLTKLDKFGYQTGYDKTEKVIWFCGDCR